MGNSTMICLHVMIEAKLNFISRPTFKLLLFLGLQIIYPQSIKATSSHCAIYTDMSEIYLTPGYRKLVVFLLEGVDSLEAHVQLSWTIKLGKICHHELWLGHGRRDGFLQREGREVGLHVRIFDC